MKAYAIIAPYQTQEFTPSRAGEARDAAIQLNHAADGQNIDDIVQFFVKGKPVDYAAFLDATLDAWEKQGAKFRETHHLVTVHYGASSAPNTWKQEWRKNK